MIALTDDLLEEWREAADARIAELSERMVASGPKAANISASELHEVSAFVSDVALIAIPSLIAEVRRSAAGQCVVGVPCDRHGRAIHGREAEELRSGIEQILRQYEQHADSDFEYNSLRRSLRALLDEVDARDSLAYLEKKDGEEDQPCL